MLDKPFKGLHGTCSYCAFLSQEVQDIGAYSSSIDEHAQGLLVLDFRSYPQQYRNMMPLTKNAIGSQPTILQFGESVQVQVY